MRTSLWVIRGIFIALCMLGGYAISQVQPSVIESGTAGVVIGFGFSGLLIALDEMLKGFSLRAFSAATFGLMLGSLIAWMVDRSELFIYAEDRPTRWMIRLCLFVGFSYIGMVLAMRSNKEDFYLIIPYVKFTAQNISDNVTVLDSSALIDGRVADLVDLGFFDGTFVIPNFVINELHRVADSQDSSKRSRGRRGLDSISKLQGNKRLEVKLHDLDFANEPSVDGKVVLLAENLKAKLLTNDVNMGKVAELRKVPHLNMNALAAALKSQLHPGDIISLRVMREGKDKGQGIGYLADGTMVVVNEGLPHVGQQVEAQVQSFLQTGVGVIVFADVRKPLQSRPPDQAQLST